MKDKFSSGYEIELDPMEKEQLEQQWDKYPKLRPGGQAAISAWGWFRRNLRVDPRKTKREDILGVLRSAVRNEPIMGKRLGGKPLTIRRGTSQYQNIQKQAGSHWLTKDGRGKGLLSESNGIFNSIRLTTGKAETWKGRPVRVVRDPLGKILTWRKA